MFALALAVVVAQMQPLASPSPFASSTPGTTVTGEPSTGRMPDNAPVSGPDDAVIRNSGSTNIGGYVVVVHPDFSADVYVNGGTKRTTVAPAQAKWLFAKLSEAMPLPDLAVTHCMKSMSFGSRTTIAYKGQVTPDLSCGGSDQTRELSRTAAIIVDQLGVKPENGIRRRLL